MIGSEAYLPRSLYFCVCVRVRAHVCMCVCLYLSIYIYLSIYCVVPLRIDNYIHIRLKHMYISL